MSDDEFPALVAAYISDRGGVRRLAAEWGVSPSYISDLRHGRRIPGEKILSRVGWRRRQVVTWEPLEMPGTFEPEPPASVA